MRILQQCVPIFLICILTTSSLSSQPSVPCPEQACCEEPVAYNDACYAAHWSAYIPITVLVAAAVFFGLADGKESGSNCHSQSLGSRSGSGSSSSFTSSSHSH